jgi:anti-anti-sigma factor
MQAKIMKEDGVCVIYLSGQLNYDSIPPFRKTCLDHLVHEKVIFHCRDLQFVGSTGITDFVETLEKLQQSSVQSPRFCGMSAEFRCLMESSRLGRAHLYEDIGQAKASLSDFFFQS